MEKIVWGYNRYSRGGRALAEKLDVRYVHPFSTKRIRGMPTIINYGCSSYNGVVDSSRESSIINSVSSVSISSDKLATFVRLSQNDLVPPEQTIISIPEFTSDISIARSWVSDGAVVGRALLRASCARGMEIYPKGSEIPETIEGVRVKLWTKYIPKKKEFRVHVFNGTVIDVQQKRKRAGQEVASTQIRNLDNGWVFTRDGIVKPPSLEPLAISVVQGLGMHYGAVDIVWNERNNRSVALECNSAPGLEGTTLENYATAIQSL